MKKSKTNTPKIAVLKTPLQWIVFVIDRSGSMQSIKTDMIGGFNSFIETQKNAKLDKCKVFAYQFDDVYESIFEDKDLNDVPELTDKTYIPRNGTALYDAIGKTIHHISSLIDSLKDSEKPNRVLVVTITDGINNSSVEYTCDAAKKLVEEKTTKDNWDFAYIGANQDAWEVGDTMGYTRGSTLSYAASSGGTALMFNKLAKSTVAYRSCADKFSFQDEPDDDVTPPTNPSVP